MDLLSFFDKNKKVERINLHAGAKRERSQFLIANKALHASIQSVNTIESGTEYANEFIKKEEKELFEYSQLIRNIPESKFDDISLATAATAMTEEAAEDLTRVYKTFNFAHHSKSNLTIKTVKDRIISTIETEPVTIIQGPTGCGKTTQVPQFILDSCYEKRKPCNIIVTQPRRIAAISIAKRVCEERDWPIGSLVGYQVGLSRYVSNDTRLVYCTTGVLLHRLITQKNMNDFTHIIIDEVHERDQDMDFLLLVVRKFLRSNSRTVKVILMSATFNVEKFSKYFSSYLGKNLVPAPVIDVTKSNYYDVKDFYLDDLASLYVGEAPPISLQEPGISKDMYELCVKLITVMNALDLKRYDFEENTVSRPTVLIFLPGIHEIEELSNTIEKNQKDTQEVKWDVVVLHSTVTSEEQNRIFESPKDGFRRIILSTNIAESSITVPDVKYIIDFCLTKQMTTDPCTNFHSLELIWASKANCQQRAGRTGRVMDGRAYRLIPKYFYSQLPDESSPEILKAPLELVILRAKVLDLDKPKPLLALALDPPDLSNMERTILLLQEAGGLLIIDDDRFDGELTDLGRVMSQLPVDIHISKMIVLGHVFSVLRETIIIGASMSVKNMFSSPFQKKLEAFTAKFSWAQNSSSDCGAFLHAYNVWLREKANARINSNRGEVLWAQRNFIQIRVLREIHALVDDITIRLGSLGIKETTGLEKVRWDEDQKNLVIKVIFAGAFYPNYFFTKTDSDEESNLRLLGGHDPLKTVYLQGWPKNQPIMLYAQHFEKYFEKCIGRSGLGMKVNFDNSSRVFVQFGRIQMVDPDGKNLEISNEIPYPVYRSLKKRQIGEKLVIPVMTPEEANKLADELNVEKTAPIYHLTRVDSVPKKSANNHMRPILPGLNTTNIVIAARQVIDPGYFWAVIISPESARKHKKLNDYINSLNLDDLEIFESSPNIGTQLLAPRESQGKTEFCRAIIQGIMMENKKNIVAHVFFMDYGSAKRIPVDCLRRLPDDNPISNIPPLAVECRLKGIKPSSHNVFNKEWTKEAKSFFEITVKKQAKLFGQIYSVVNSVVILTLKYTNESNEEININELLITKRYAEAHEESYLSKYNNSIRQHAAKFELVDKLNHEEMQHNQFYSPDKYVTAPENHKCKSEVVLRGPFSPLEVGLYSHTNAAVGRKIRISEESSNAILLDPTLDNPQPRLLIAGSVSQSAITGNLTLRGTAMMPNIPGLASLLCLIFAPQVELRRSVYKTRYIGALCGLGYDKRTQQSLFPEHDMPINFDVDITIDDMQNINRLRHWMSAGIFITTDETNVSEEVSICQNKVKEIFTRIIEKDRESIPYEIDLSLGKWCRYPPELFLVPGKVSLLKQNIFQLHHALDLEEKNPEKEEMIEHLNKLKSIASQSLRESTDQTIECKLCNKEIYGILQMRTHITSIEHRTKEQQVRVL